MVRLPLADLTLVILFGGHGAGNLHVVAEPLVFFHGNERALLRLTRASSLVMIPKRWTRSDIGAEIGHPVRNVHIQPGNDAHHKDERGHARITPSKVRKLRNL